MNKLQLKFLTGGNTAAWKLIGLDDLSGMYEDEAADAWDQPA